MRMLLFYILLVAFGCQQTTVNGQQTPFLETENLKTSESEKGCEQQTISNETFLESEESVNISEICGNEKTNHKLAQKKSEKSCEPRAMSNESFLESENLKTSESEKSCEPRAMSNETFFESEKSVNISEICGNEKTNHRLVQKKSEKSCEPRAMSNEQKSPNVQGSQHEAQSLKKTVDCCPLTVDYFENQIRLADSLYKNYLPQYNFEEVKAAVMFFDSLRLTTVLLESENLKTSESEKGSEQRAMSHEPFLESENLKTSESEKSCEPRAMSNETFLESENLKTSESEKRLKSQGRNAQSSQHEAQSLKKTVDCCPLTVDIEYQRARAHYYHAVGLTERDDIVGACEHYLTALEIMEFETENLRTSKSGKGSEPRAMSHEQKFRNAHSSKLKALITKK